jgi:HAD superfamily hydrolase (TIGR01509 family)
MPLDAVLFEFDGLLAETAPARREALARALAEEGVSLSAAQSALLDPWQAPRSVAFDVARRQGIQLDETALDLVGLRTERHAAELLGTGLSLAPGAAELLHALAGQAQVGIVTDAPRELVDHVLGMAGLEHEVEFLVTARERLAPKPAPDGYLAALERLGRRRPLRSLHVLALEASPAGITAATAAGIRCVAVGVLAAHEAMRAAAYLPSLAGVTVDRLASLASPPVHS